MRKLILLAPLAVAIATGTSPAHSAGAVCRDRAEIIEVLSSKYGEQQTSYGLQSDRRVLELYASANGSWTAILTMPGGKSCVVASGEAWTTLPPPLPGEPA